MKFPDFVVIGGMKCGTTVLWHNLNRHPKISMCKNRHDPGKASTEIRFWDDGPPHHNWKKGLEWYKDLFSGDCCGEKSANYIEDHKAFQRMQEYIPAAKLVLCVRDPVFRAYSNYQMHPKTTFERALLEENDRHFLARGCYLKMIEDNVLPFFPRDQLYIVIQERMKADTDGEIAKLCGFLGVSEHRMGVQKVAASEATDRNLDLVKDGKVPSYKKWKSKYPPMSDKVRKQLIKHYRDHNHRFFDFLGYKIPEWL